MLFAMDVGNSNMVLGLFRQVGSEPGQARFAPELVTQWRITTPESRTVDELGVTLRSLFGASGVSVAEITGVAISSVVPPLDSMLRQLCEVFFKIKPLFIEPGVKTGMPVLTDNPAEVGADRIVNCVAAFERFQGACIIVDMGTATTFDVVSVRGEFVGGAIAPGLGIASEALFTRAARLPRIEIRKPAKVIGTGTVDNLQIGLYYGYIGLVDGILERMLERLKADADPESVVQVIATGGLAHLIAGGSRFIGVVDDQLTLTGLRIVFERNLGRQAKQERHRRRS